MPPGARCRGRLMFVSSAVSACCGRRCPARCGCCGSDAPEAKSVRLGGGWVAVGLARLLGCRGRCRAATSWGGGACTEPRSLLFTCNSHCGVEGEKGHLDANPWHAQKATLTQPLQILHQRARLVSESASPHTRPGPSCVHAPAKTTHPTRPRAVCMHQQKLHTRPGPQLCACTSKPTTPDQAPSCVHAPAKTTHPTRPPAVCMHQQKLHTRPGPQLCACTSKSYTPDQAPAVCMHQQAHTPDQAPSCVHAPATLHT